MRWIAGSKHVALIATATLTVAAVAATARADGKSDLQGCEQKLLECHAKVDDLAEMCGAGGLPPGAVPVDDPRPENPTPTVTVMVIGTDFVGAPFRQHFVLPNAPRDLPPFELRLPPRTRPDEERSRCRLEWFDGCNNNCPDGTDCYSWHQIGDDPSSAFSGLFCSSRPTAEEAQSYCRAVADIRFCGAGITFSSPRGHAEWVCD